MQVLIMYIETLYSKEKDFSSTNSDNESVQTFLITAFREHQKTLFYKKLGIETQK